MHVKKSVVGILRKAEDKYGNEYEDWRSPYINQPGLLLVCQSDSQPEKYSIYFFTSLLCDCPGNWLHTTRGSIKEECDALTIRTKNSVYEFELDPGCVSPEEMPLLLLDVEAHFQDGGR